MSGGGGNDQFAWLGLLKWSLAYTDGTENVTPGEISAEDRAFLEKVMSEGIVDEGVIMRRTLLHLVKALQDFLGVGAETAGDESAKLLAAISAHQAQSSASSSSNPAEPDLGELLDELDELRDIVEQIDFARSFVNMNALPFLLGAASSGLLVPERLRASCLSVIATLAQNNPDVQDVAKESLAVAKLSETFASSSDGGDAYKAKILQALSAVVRGHDPNSADFFANDQAVAIVKDGIVSGGTVCRRAVFLARALLTDDNSTPERVAAFADVMETVVELAGSSEEIDVRETCIGLLNGVLTKGGESAKTVYPYAEKIKNFCQTVVEKWKGEANEEEKGYLAEDMAQWLALMKLLKQAVNGGGGSVMSKTAEAAPLMLK
ncbi:hypothetical protein TrVE_jg4656 [Triparma verrucosa]|uniref:Uncharacterized protein n=1 Tax=Triparma verrucosa TaxID=1606542 RepID=A0A9W7CA34_9STRA|nr:hypothetical protein TrVE_jg4656 [Triparma verrucosa]